MSNSKTSTVVAVDYSTLEERVVGAHLENLTALRKLLRAYNPAFPMAPGMASQYRSLMDRLGWEHHASASAPTGSPTGRTMQNYLIQAACSAAYRRGGL